MVNVVVVTIMMQGDTVELFEWIEYLASRCGEPRIKGHTLHFARADTETLVDSSTALRAQIDAVALLDVTKVDRVDAAALIRDDWWLGMAQECPRRCPEEGV